ncbi:MAG TPA: carboxymuconolactone decarboxylase family protein [Gaiellaceae bacterium]|jgi:AhpD family alkylhydroperoxidase|nr:carboxymuconolactone decarboxylase family protein [Gaiellaceae bacterium]
MARVPYPTRDDYPAAYVAAYDRMLRERGDPPLHVFAALANIPNLLDTLLTFTREMREGAAIERRLRELAIVAVALATDATYELEHHWNTALAAGLRREQLEQLADAETSDAFDERERAIVRYAREATLSLNVSDETWSGLRSHFSVREAMDVVMAVAWYNAVARVLLPLQIELEDWHVRE